MLPARNDAYQAAADVKNLGDVRVFDANRTHATDQENVAISQLGLERRGGEPTQPLSVMAVMAVCAPFEIGHDIIRFHGVDVVDHRKCFGIRDERHGDESMDTESGLLSLLAQNNSGVAVANLPGRLSDGVAYDLGVAPSGVAICVYDRSGNASHPANGADFVKSFIANHFFPFFNQVAQGFFFPHSDGNDPTRLEIQTQQGV